MTLTEYLYGLKLAGKYPFRILPDRVAPIRFRGNLTLGDGRYLQHPSPGYASMIKLNNLFTCYTHVLIASGAPVPNIHPSLPPTDGKIIPALDFVYWYTGHPNSTVDLMHYEMPKVLPRNVTIVGNGNVALDCARILLCDPARLERYSLPPRATEVLRKSLVQHVSIVGRRGPREASFTAKELREMMNLDGVAFTGVDPEVMAQAEAGEPLDRRQKRIFDILKNGSRLSVGDAGVKRTWSLDFWRSPTGVTTRRGTAVSARTKRLMHLTLAHTSQGTGGAKVAETGETSTVMTGLIITALGHRCTPETTPFCDPALGHIRTVGGSLTHPEAATTVQGAADATAAQTAESASAAGETATTSPLADPEVAAADVIASTFTKPAERPPAYGQVIHPISGRPLQNIFAAGWAARGAKGVLGTTMLDAHAVGEAIVEDWLAYLQDAEAQESAKEALPSPHLSPASSAHAYDTEDGKQQEPESDRNPPTLADIHAVNGATRRMPLGPTTIVHRVMDGLFPHSGRLQYPVVTYPEFLELQAMEAEKAMEAGVPVRLEWPDVHKFLKRSDG